MDVDITAVATIVVPYVTAAVGAYGAAVLSKLQEEAADATVGLGSKVLHKLLRREESAPALAGAVRELAEDPTDADRQSLLRLQIRKILAADGQLAGEVAELVEGAGATITASGNRAVAAHTISGSIVSTGDDAKNTL